MSATERYAYLAEPRWCEVCGHPLLGPGRWCPECKPMPAPELIGKGVPGAQVEREVVKA